MLARAGGRVAIVDIPSSAGEHVAESLGDTTRFLPTDVTAPEQVEASIAAAADWLGGVDLCVNCAGINPGHRIIARDGTLHPLELFRRTIDVNLVGTFDVIRHVASRMAANEPGEDGERGLIVNVASIAGYEGQAGQAAYTASKGAIIALTLQLARDLARYGIRVMAIAPGMMDTAMAAAIDEPHRQALVDLSVFPKRMGTPKDFAGLVRTFMENTMINGEVVRLDAATRLGA
jgi:3-hydroxyacyl-CoA dehydrogenase/3-hydroxy-2-methylbutyryl-CoA dehydrogenase